MTHIEFFKFQAKNLLHDWQYYQENHITKELKTKSKFFGHDLFKYTNLIKETTFPLARAQHYVAKLADCTNWKELVTGNEEEISLARIIYEEINCSYDLEHWNMYKANSVYYNVTTTKKIQLAKQYFRRHEKDNKSVPKYTNPYLLTFNSYAGAVKLHEYLLNFYGITKSDFNKKPDWMKEELRKEHARHLREKQIEYSEMMKISKMTNKEYAKYEEDLERLEEEYNAYEILRECGVPFDIFGSPLGIGED